MRCAGCSRRPSRRRPTVPSSPKTPPPGTRGPYRGSGPIINDIAGGHLPFGIVTVADALARHQAGNIRILAVASAARSPFLSDVPTLKESGIDLVADSWYGMWLPAGSPPD